MWSRTWVNVTSLCKCWSVHGYQRLRWGWHEQFNESAEVYHWHTLDEHVHSLIGWCISHIACRMDVQSVYASVVNFLNLNNMQDWIAQNEHPWTLSVVLQHICFMIWKCLLCLFRVWVICSVRKFIYWDGYRHKVVPEPFNYWFSVSVCDLWRYLICYLPIITVWHISGGSR